jgi:hypothetical protein
VAVLATVAILLGAATGPSTAHAQTRAAVAHGPNGKIIQSQQLSAGAPHPTMYYIGHAAGEPTFGFTKDGHMFYTASDGCLTSCTGSSEMIDNFTPGAHAILESTDGGQKWTDVSPKVGPLATHHFSMDPMIYVDPVTGRIFDSDLNLACSQISFSSDEGKSWTESPIGCGEPVNDHQTIFAGVPPKGGAQPIGYKRVTYYCINHPAFTRCDKSLDGGQSWIPSTNISAPSCSGLNGHGVTDSKGVIYLPMGANCGTPQLAISHDEGNTWTELQPGGSLREAGGDPSVAVDAAGTLYYVFVNSADRHVLLFTSADQGKHWSKPIDVTAPGVTQTNLATIDVGDPGKVAIAYYGTTGQGTVKTWNGYLTIGEGVLGANPVFYSASVNDPAHPLKIGDCGPGRCGRVLDFIDVNISPSGQAFGSFVDACMAACEKTHQESIVDNQGAIGTLIGGFKLK